ncbi:hypothetical protein [Dyadobacter diqingensis]|uniref:hypothetical protein n=1 Tax=Dyadobacter diqingensis TaxID=2938121 RepID=UPI0020C54068|nr:hypothetical protein [Dyadobacter diqingensis]
MSTQPIPWISVCKHAPYFEDDNGKSWTPVGQNDAIIWPDLEGLFQRKNTAQVESHFAYLASQRVTCIRIMMEYCQTEHRYIEKPAGSFQTNMVRFWDDLFKLCEKYQIRILLTPFDTFWMAKRWRFHPYNKRNGGPCESKFKWLTCPDMLAATKNRFDFFIRQWGASGALFGWDLWNEINPKHAGKQTENMAAYVEQISDHIRNTELTLYGKSHLQTVSVFAPLMKTYEMTALIFRHPLLDFSTTHFYDAASIDNPKNTYLPAIATGDMVIQAIEHLPDGRPFLDSEHGPITYFKRYRKGLPQQFDELYFLHIQWAHLASGAAGGGMRWPYRHPHVLTTGMRAAQRNLSEFIVLIDWTKFNRKNISRLLTINEKMMHIFGCSDKSQAVIWLLPSPGKSKKKQSTSIVSVPGLDPGTYKIHFWDTKQGLLKTEIMSKNTGDLNITLQRTETDLALAVRKQT